MVPKVVVSKSAAAKPAAAPVEVKATNGHATSQGQAEDVKAYVEQAVKTAFDKWMASPKLETAGPQGWWDILAIGPIKPGATTLPPGTFSGPLLPNQVMRAGETAYIITVLILNPAFPTLGPSACDVLSNFSLPYEITYQTGNLTNWTSGPAALNVEQNFALVPGQCVYINDLEFVAEAEDEVLYEVNVSARIFGCGGDYAPPFAGFAREIVDIDPSLFRFAPGLVGQPIRFMVYGPHPATEP